MLRLLAVGQSNQQIADEFVISLNTVNRHVSNIYAKTGVANRAQAAVYAKEHGIVLCIFLTLSPDSVGAEAAQRRMRPSGPDGRR